MDDFDPAKEVIELGILLRYRRKLLRKSLGKEEDILSKTRFCMTTTKINKNDFIKYIKVLLNPNPR